MDAMKIITEGMIKADQPKFEVGDTVKKGQTVCIIEAMKLLNEVEAETDGVVKEICVENGQPVEYGQNLLIIG